MVLAISEALLTGASARRTMTKSMPASTSRIGMISHAIFRRKAETMSSTTTSGC